MTTWLPVRAVVRDVVAKVAPEELPVVDGLAEQDDEAALRLLVGARQRGEPLGFGLGEVLALVTPVVWLVLDEAAKKAAGAVVDGAAKGTKTLLRRALRRKSREVVLPPLTPEQQDWVRRLLLETAAREGLDEARAVQVADAVVARLKHDTTEQPPE